MLTQSKPQIRPLPAQYNSRPATLDDADAIVELFNLCAKIQNNGHGTNADEVRADWTTPKYNMETSTRVVTTKEGKIIAAFQVWDIDEPTVNLWSWGDVHPDHQRHGIGTYLMDWAVARAHDVAQTVEPDLQVALRTNAVSTYEPANALLSTYPGNKLIRHFLNMAIHMTDPPPPPPIVMGNNGTPIVIRHLENTDADRRRFYQALMDSFQDHWGFVMPKNPDEDFKVWQHWFLSDSKFDHTVWFAALDGDEIAGLSLCKVEKPDDPDTAWVDTLGVLRPWRRRNLGLALLLHTYGVFYNRGQYKVGLGVDASSLTGATRLYEKSGMHVTRHFNSYERIIRPGRDISRQALDE